MIARRIDRQAHNDSYRALALYIADAQKDGEKVLTRWTTGGQADDYLIAIVEVEATQALNTRAVGAKTYHLLVSFRPEDEDKLTPEIMREMELTFAQGLGLAEHQRHAAIHKNTNNLHLHIAYNLIHPERLTRREPFRDFKTLSRVCRELEKKYKLAIDPGMETASEKAQPKATPRLRTMEIQSGQESLFSYAQRHKEDILSAMQTVEAWPDVHQVFASYGLRLKLHGNGLAVTDNHGKTGLKASSLDRSLSKAKMEARFGLFQAPDRIFSPPEPAISYTAEPLHHGPERDKLYAQFQEEMNQRRSALADIERDYQAQYDKHLQIWQSKADDLRRRPIFRKDKKPLWVELRRLEKLALTKIRQEAAEKRKIVRQERPYSTWIDFLKFQANQGQETALTVLQSGRRPERDEPKMGEQFQTKNSRNLPVVTQMRALFYHPDSPFRSSVDLKYTIDAKGTVIFTLPSGGTVRDTGTAIHFSAWDKRARIMAGLLAQNRWGQMAELTGNSLKVKPTMEPIATQDRTASFFR